VSGSRAHLCTTWFLCKLAGVSPTAAPNKPEKKEALLSQLPLCPEEEGEGTNGPGNKNHERLLGSKDFTMNLFQRLCGGNKQVTRSSTTGGRRTTLGVETLEARTLMSGTPIQGIELVVPAHTPVLNTTGQSQVLKLTNQQILGQMQAQFNSYDQKAANYIDHTYCPLGGDYTGAAVSTLFNSPNVKVDAAINPNGSVAVEMLIPISGSFKYDVRGPWGTDAHDFKWSLSADADVKFTLPGPNQGSVGNVVATVSVIDVKVTGDDDVAQAFVAVGDALGEIPSSIALPSSAFANPLDAYFAALHSDGYQNIGVRMDTSDGMLEYFPETFVVPPFTGVLGHGVPLSSLHTTI